MSSATSTDVSRQLRLILSSSPEALSFTEFLDLVDAFVLESSAAADPASPIAHLEDELQAIYNDVFNHAVLAHAELFLAVLYHLRPVLPPTSLISTWFDLALRPALREPKLPPPAVNHAKQLILAACDTSPDDGHTEHDAERQKRKDKIAEFRRRLMDLYLLDAFNESSGDDILEWADLDVEQRDKKACWKTNLEDVLVKVGVERPQDLLTEIYHCFANPSSRLQLLILLTAYTSQPNFSAHAPVLASHPLMTSLLHSLLLDNSSTVCAIALTIITKLLPIFAVHACDALKRLLPHFLAVLARIICWRVRETPSELAEAADYPETEATPGSEEALDDVIRSVNTRMNSLPVREDLAWTRLEMTFDGATSAAPSPHQYFTFLYYLFPCNVIRFLRYPVKYLQEAGLESPYAVEWDDALDEDQIKSKSESLLRGHIMHPVLIWRDATEELARPDFWAQYDVPKIVGDCTMIDVRNAALGMQQRETAASSSLAPPQPPIFSPEVQSPVHDVSGNVSTAPTPPASGRRRVSLQDMIATSVALKYGLDIEVVQPSAEWPASIFPASPPTRSQSRGDDESAVDPESASLRPSLERLRGDGEHEVPSHVGQAIAGLQRDVLLLRNELNFELWMTRENVKHIGRLYQDKVLSRTAEIERQGLHNKLREYKTEASRMQRELKEHKEQASKIKNEYADYNRKLQDKLGELRNEKKAWMTEAAAMRAADKEAKDTFAAQGKLLAEAVQKVFQLETKIKENRHKVDRLHDYESQLDQLIKLQRLWEVDVERLNDQAEYLQAFTSKYKKMEFRLEAYEKTHTEMEEAALRQRRQVHEMEVQLQQAHKQLEAARKAVLIESRAHSSTEYAKITEANKRLREENAELRDEVEEMRAMNDILKVHVSERRASSSPGPRSSLPKLSGGRS